MILEKTVPARRKKAFVRPWVMAWMALAFFAAIYVWAAIARPELIAQYAPPFGAGDTTLRETNRAALRALAEVQNVRQSLGQLQIEIAKLRTDLRAEQESSMVLAKRTAALEERGLAANPEPAEPERVVAEAPQRAVPKRVETQRVETQRAEARSDQQPAAETKPAPRAPLTPLEAEVAGLTEAHAPAQPPPALIETGSLAKSHSSPAKPVAFGPATVSRPPQPVGIELASATSVDALRLSWSVLADRHNALKNLEARYVAGGETDAPSYDLVAGPFKSAAEARKACKALQAEGSPCKVGVFSGNAL